MKKTPVPAATNPPGKAILAQLSQPLTPRTPAPMIWLAILILAVLQGIAEFLPISSSGHVVVGAELFGIEEKLTVNIALHAGTLLAILVFYWRRILRLFGEDRRVIILLVVGTVPAAIFGFIAKHHFADVLKDPLVAGFMFPLTGLILLWAAAQETGETTCRQLRYGQALMIGCFQAFAILPGISRSGATIAAGLGSGMRRDEAATFSFLLAIPAVGGATALMMKDLVSEPVGSTPLGALALGAGVSFAVGLLSLWWLVRWLKQGRLHYFAWYVIPLGAAVIAWLLS